MPVESSEPQQIVLGLPRSGTLQYRYIMPSISLFLDCNGKSQVSLGPLLSPCITDSEVLGFFFCLFNLSKSILLLFLSSLMGAPFTHLNKRHTAADVIAAQQNTGVARFHN